MGWVLVGGKNAEHQEQWLRRLVLRYGYAPVDLREASLRGLAVAFAHTEPEANVVFRVPGFVAPPSFRFGQHTWPGLARTVDAILVDREAELLYVNRTALRLNWTDPARELRVTLMEDWKPPRPVGPKTDPYGVGTRRPRVWILGEQCNPRLWAAPLPLVSASGLEMVWPHVDPWKMRVSNVWEPEETRRERVEDRVYGYWKDLGRPKILCLGVRAARGIGKVPEMVADAETLEHPQYVWRFLHRHVPQWRENLCEVLAAGVHEEAV